MKNSKKIFFLLLSIYAVSASAWVVPSGQWGAAGPIAQMYIYPGCAVIVQGGSTPGPAGCSNDNMWSFNWADFSPADAARIQSMLLAAYMAKTNVQAYFYSTGCGPENKKQFAGMLNFSSS